MYCTHHGLKLNLNRVVADLKSASSLRSLPQLLFNFSSYDLEITFKKKMSLKVYYNILVHLNTKRILGAVTRTAA